MANKVVHTRELIQEVNLELVNTDADTNRVIAVSDINRPGLPLAGFLKYHAVERVQIIGKTEMEFLLSLPEDLRKKRLMGLCASEQTPCLVVSRGQQIPECLFEIVSLQKLPLLRSELATTKLAGRITRFLDQNLAPETLVHGVLVDVYGIGILIQGASGIGKSETALELVKRGHRLVADDAVEISQIEDNILVGTTPPLLKYLLEIRGLGVLNVMTLFGAGAVRTHKKIEMLIKLEAWKDEVAYDRLGLDEEKVRILGTDLTCVTIPVRPGRNLAVIIEVAAMNQRLKRMGYNAARELSEKLLKTLGDDAEMKG
ncbi:HPr(Ser) kinase/phosphatase [Fodinisporobacter ferrooxydans]|uniref:HPr kinase/phosphorylase n=1 Tax=Fodinisporobacter ferrooxydans TaxID=2901836 RepID=A0ABY4CLG2_9BACL|nr:HPr(Ser) kinase/phosphatase [Alicyclobacillaceae bacterium MYW30-H2]